MYFFFFFLTYGSFRSLLLSFEIFEGFLAVLLLPVSNLILSCQITYSVSFQSFEVFSDLFCGTPYVL